MKKFIVIEQDELKKVIFAARQKMSDFFGGKIQDCNDAMLHHAFEYVKTDDKTAQTKSIMYDECAKAVDEFSIKAFHSFTDIVSFIDERHGTPPNKFEADILKEVFKNRSVSYADNIEPNTPGNMKDESQWHHDCQGYKDGALEAIEYIVKNYDIKAKPKK